MKKMTLAFGALFLAATPLLARTPVTLPGTTGAANKQFVGTFAGGQQLAFAFSGTVDLVGGGGGNWLVAPTGAVTAPVTFPGYGYANVGASGYPTVNGGNGINNFVGGGANYDTGGASYGFAGATSTDTTRTDLVRFGGVVGTFAASPSRADWFFIGDSATITVPGGGGTLYLAVNETLASNNTGQFSGTVAVVPEAGTFALFVLPLCATLTLRQRRK